MSTKILKATHGSDKIPLKIGNGIEIPCYVLEDGTAVVSMRGMQSALGFDKEASGLSLTKLIKRSKLIPYIPDDLATALENPLHFKRVSAGGSQPLTYGQEATVLIDICYVFIDAKAAGVKLTPKEIELEMQAQVIVRAFSKTGIIAVIYNVTGYQDQVVKGALNEILNKFLLKEAKKYEVTFPLELYRVWFKLNNWEWKPDNAQKRTPLVGKWTVDLIYNRMAPGLLKELERRNPKNEKGHREHKHFQLLTDEIGEPKLREFFGGLIALGKANSSWRKYMDMVNRVYPKYGDTLYLDFPNEE